MSSARVQIPNRFEALVQMTTSEEELPSIVRPVKKGLDAIQQIYDDMVGAGQGAFLVLVGLPGSGKSTFLHTLRFFFEGVRTFTVDPEQPVDEAMQDLKEAPERLRLVVLKGREALASTSAADIEVALHAINQFIRTREGSRTLVVWPCNTAEVAERLLSIADPIGGDALLGVYPEGFRFEGPPKEEFVAIARGTVEALNGGATLTALGVTEQRARELAEEAATIGAFLKSLREEERRNRNALASLLPEQERHNLWIVVIAGNDPETEVGTLTSGAHFSADIDRLLSSTDANVVQDLKRYPAKLGLLGRSFDARILYVPIMTALAVVRDHADATTRQALLELGLSMSVDGQGARRLAESQLGRALRNEPVTTRAVGRKPGDDRKAEFEKLTRLAKTDDGSLNRIFGDALKAAGLIASYTAEESLGEAQKRSTDLLCRTNGPSVRLEFMWRSQTSVGDIAKYVLEKLYHYGRAIGFLNGG